jgi:hypothetical protein
MTIVSLSKARRKMKIHRPDANTLKNCCTLPTTRIEVFWIECLDARRVTACRASCQSPGQPAIDGQMPERANTSVTYKKSAVF